MWISWQERRGVGSVLPRSRPVVTRRFLGSLIRRTALGRVVVVVGARLRLRRSRRRVVLSECVQLRAGPVRARLHVLDRLVDGGDRPLWMSACVLRERVGGQEARVVVVRVRHQDSREGERHVACAGSGWSGSSHRMIHPESSKTSDAGIRSVDRTRVTYRNARSSRLRETRSTTPQIQSRASAGRARFSASRARAAASDRCPGLLGSQRRRRRARKPAALASSNPNQPKVAFAKPARAAASSPRSAAATAASYVSRRAAREVRIGEWQRSESVGGVEDELVAPVAVEVGAFEPIGHPGVRTRRMQRAIPSIPTISCFAVEYRTHAPGDVGTS